MRSASRQETWNDERGFTLVEVLFTIIIMGIVLTIASSSWFGAIESRRVDSATNQVVADLRLAHSQATNRLTNSSFVVSTPDSSTYQVGPVGALETRYLPGDDRGDQGTPRTKIVAAPTVMFKPNGEATVPPSGNIVVSSVDGIPSHTIEINSLTSRIRVVS